MKKNILYISVLLIIAIILVYAESVMLYARQAMVLCYEIIIPSLFPFFVCSGLLIYSGFATVLARCFQTIMRPMFNVAPSGAAAFVLGIISGFPLGAVCAKDLYKSGNLSKVEAERLLAFCNNSGPLFIIGSVGTAIYLKPSYGVMLYLIHIISSLIVGVIFRNYGKAQHNSPPTHINTNELPITNAVATALKTASDNIISVCFSIIFFSAISQTLLDIVPFTPILRAVASGMFEFSTGVLQISGLDTDIFIKLVMSAFVVGFSGLSVHLQVMSATADTGLSLKPYILGKLLHGTISAGICALVLYFSRTQLVFSQASKPLSLSCFVSCVLMLIITIIMLVISLIQLKRN